MSLRTIDGATESGEISDTSPSIPRILTILEPIIFAIATSVRPRKAATIEVASSGAPVPPATMVRPITRSLMPAN